jgi:carbonic anhydrase/acetyltransferase-like protein (isoleucine patch superfamily)
MPGARVGDRVFPGEGTLVPAGMKLPSDMVAVGFIGAGVKIIGDSHGPVRIGNDVQILENTVLHLLPDNELIIDDRAIVGPGAMIHGCHIGASSVIEPGAIVCDGSVVGSNCVVRAGAVVKQRSRLADGTEIDGFPAVEVGRIDPPELPAWALRPDDLPARAPRGPRRCRTSLGLSE